MYNPQDLAIYIHWPFCKSKCPYCDFYKQIKPNVDQSALIDEYIAALQRYRQLLPDRHIKSIFFGGGTPSLLKPQNVEKLVDCITKLWSVLPDIEISLEANPNSFYKQMFADLRHAGINRLSLGVQALNEKDLHFLGRTHSLEQARQCLTEITSVFSNHSADLIYARPEQKLADWQHELLEIASYGLKHISLYQLTIEPNTVFARRNVQPLAEDEAAAMYDFTRQYLAAQGYEQYEVSNFAVQGFACIHNLTYWQGGDYIGIGQSAHGRLYIDNRHIAAEYPFVHENLTAEQRAEELLLMGLRLTSGIHKPTFAQICGITLSDFINKTKKKELKDLHLLEENNDYIYATFTGMPVLDYIIRQLCS